MKRFTAVLGAIALAASLPNATAAQSSSSLAGWIGLMLTPAGALPPVHGGDPGGGSFVARYGHWEFGPGDDETTNFGAGFRFSAGNGRMTVNLGMGRVADCTDCNTIMGGLEYEKSVAESSLGANTKLGFAINPALGIGKPTDDDGSFQSLSIKLPITLSLGSGVTPFLAPGIGFGRISGGGDSESGVRTMLGGGITVSGLGPLQITASAQKVFLEEAPTLYGFAIAFGK
ncbi:MAG TPA: hypothetical protein VJR92_02240 [Gemmatimonadaceae bacterium]|nr:hypothetical protein [Gemmatimonadaceae bacterium]